MSLGTRVGPYQITATPGAGGMGEVYKAIDTRLNRPVAIKVLTAGFAPDLNLRERFEREARTLASLSHPHICPIHDFGSVDGTDYLVMGFLDGDTLADRLHAGRLPARQGRSRSPSRSRTRWTRLMVRESCTVISSRATSC